MLEKSKNKVEQRAITKVRELIDDIECFRHDLKDTDKNISWDGTIEMYNGNVDKKENYDYTIDVQVKGRTTNKKRLSSKYRFALDRVDLQNFLKKDGAILIACVFKKDGSDYKIYCSELLPYNIRLLLKQYTTNNIKVEMKEIKNSESFEIICRSFKLDREIQKGINEKNFDEDNLLSNKGKISKFYAWNKDPKSFNPKNLVGSWKYFYTFDENGYAVSVSYGMLANMVESLNAHIYNKEKKLIYEDVRLETNTEGNKIFFGKAFVIDFIKNKFRINICGTLSDRLKQLEFINDIFDNKGFLINDIRFNINIDKEEQNRFKNLMEKYTELREFFKKHNIDKDINFDEWTDTDFNKLERWIEAIERNIPISLNSTISLLGSVDIKDIKLSVFATKRNDGKFDIESIWNNKQNDQYYFKYGDGEKSIETNIFYLALNVQAYQSDDINFEEMKEKFKEVSLTEGEYILMNLQMLEVLKAYDITKSMKLLDYAEFLANILMKHDADSPIYYINYAQILKRQNKMTSEVYKKLIMIRDNNSLTEIKICCNLLLNNKTEANILTQGLNKQTLDEFKKFPIAIYFE